MTLALYYRPRIFDDFSGQSHVLLPLQECLRQHYARERDLPTGFAFVGPSGCGKTSLARVVASSLNCEERTDDTEPCTSCPSCMAIWNQNSDAVIEIDGATSGLVDHIRDLKRQAMTRHSGQVKVIVIDEVHAMSREAFSALLKQLEEPPPDVLYIMCTTDPHQVPETILGRGLVFTLRKISHLDIMMRLSHVMAEEGMEVSCAPEDAALETGAVLEAVAKRSKGQMRDALNLLEQLSMIGINNENLDKIAPDTLPQFANRFLDTVVAGDVESGMAAIHETFNLYRDGVAMGDAVSHVLGQAIMANRRGVETPLSVSTLAQLLEVSWDLAVVLARVPINDPVRIEQLWFHMRHKIGPLKSGVDPTEVKVDELHQLDAATQDLLKSLN